MQKVLRKRVLRDLKENRLRYLSLSLLIIFSIYLVVSLIGAAQSIISGTQESAKKHRIEDGQFTVFVPLSKKEKHKLIKKGIELEEQFYLDYQMKDKDKSTLRVFKNRKNIDCMVIEKGTKASKAKEVVLEKRYCSEHDLLIGDKIKIGKQTLTISGICSVPDYDAPYKKLGDSTVDSKQFGLAFLTADGYEQIKKKEDSIHSEEYVYAYRLNGAMSNKELRKKLKKIKIEASEIDDDDFQDYWKELCEKKIPKEMKKFLSNQSNQIGLTGDFAKAFGVNQEVENLTQFLTAKENPRIGAAADDQVINKLASLVAGVILIVLFAYVLSVFIAHNIEKESSVIGALYALGVKRKDLLYHYLTLPVIVTIISSIIGTVLGFSPIGIPTQMADTYVYYSVPELKIVYPPYLLFYALFMPPILAILVNWMVIYKKLGSPVLSLLRNEEKQSKIRNVSLGNLGFVRKFQMRQLLREIRSSFAVLLGMFITLLIVMLSLDCFVMCSNLSKENKADVKYEYMYTYKYPEKKVPRGGEACFAQTLKKEKFGYHLDVTVLGIDDKNPYFDAKVKERENSVILSSAAAQKFQVKVGDKIVLTDEEKDRDYAFTVDGITSYSVGMYAFMNIDSMRDLFGKDDTYYNVVFSDKKLDIPSGRLYSTLSKAEVEKASDVFVNMMKPMVAMLVLVSAIIFCVVMYLMLKVMMDRSAFAIALVKIFGYRMSEIRKLYLNGNFYVIAIGALICIPLSKKAMDALYPVLVSNIACGMNLRFPMPLYAGIYLAIIFFYLFVSHFQIRRLKKIQPAQVLKNRE